MLSPFDNFFKNLKNLPKNNEFFTQSCKFRSSRHHKTRLQIFHSHQFLLPEIAKQKRTPKFSADFHKRKKLAELFSRMKQTLNTMAA